MDVYWFEEDAAEVPVEEDWLSAAEAKHLHGLRFERRRADWRLGRWTAKNAVAAALGLGRETLSHIEIRSAATGAPMVFFNSAPVKIAISLSHRAGVGACAIAPPGVSLGCDVEMIEPHGETFAGDYFTDEEQALVAEAGTTTDRLRLTSLIWSAKESALKALGEGLRLDTRAVVVKLLPIAQARHESEQNALRSPSICPGDSVERADWNPLQVHCANGMIFLGWWNQAGPLLRTMVALPRPHPPVFSQPGTPRITAFA